MRQRDRSLVPQPLCMTKHRGTRGTTSAASRSPRPGQEGRARHCRAGAAVLPPSSLPRLCSASQAPVFRSLRVQGWTGTGWAGNVPAGPGKEAREEESGQAWGSPTEGLHGEGTQVTRRQREGGRGHRSLSIRSRHGGLDRRSELDTAAETGPGAGVEQREGR